MSNRGIVEFYYSAELPADSIALAKIATQDYIPNQVISIDNNIYQGGYLGLKKSATSPSAAPDFSAAALNQSLQFGGDTVFYVGNQFFQITDVTDSTGIPLYYKHFLPTGVSSAVVLDVNGTTVNTASTVSNGYFYHDLPDGYYQLRYVDVDGFVQKEMLLFTPSYSRGSYSTGPTTYTYIASVLTLASIANRYIRFTGYSGYQAKVPYNAPSNSPWFLRISYGVFPLPPEWAKQPFIPQSPYLLGTWTSGSYVTSNVIQFEKKNIYYDANHYPDILVFDKDNNIKYAIDGTSIYVQSTKGYEYPWKRGLINSFDPDAARIEVGVTLDPTDIIFGFYSYAETDVIYTDLDVNPFTNPLVRNAEIDLYVKTNGDNPLKYLYYRILDSSGTLIQTNDPNPPNGTANYFARIGVGISISTAQMTVTDIRQLGGGLSSDYQDIPQAANFWDLGYWDGKPYPTAGALIIYLPYAILSSVSRAATLEKIKSILPLGIYPVIRYYDNKGNEYV